LVDVGLADEESGRNLFGGRAVVASFVLLLVPFPSDGGRTRAEITSIPTRSWTNPFGKLGCSRPLVRPREQGVGLAWFSI
jgi:hypothetical protein